MRIIKLNKKKGIVFWITGLSGSGKTKIGHKIKNDIIKKYGPTILFSGDDIRNIFDLKKYSPQDRLKIVSRYCKLCRNLSNQKINVIFCVVGLMHAIYKWNKKNIENFKRIKETKYPNNPIISRVSGVKFNNEQNFNSMEKIWGKLVDQVAFVNYNPWENSYNKPPNDIIEPCSDLWRRMFVWWDGKINPCDVDYKSRLSVGHFSRNSIQELWNSEEYKLLREKHLNKKRQKISPCSSCVVI